MDNQPLLQQALAEDWNKLPSVIQRHYKISNNSSSCLQGTMEIGYPTFLLPLISLIHLFGGLVVKRGKEIKTQVKKSTRSHDNKLYWQRTLQYPNNEKDYFYSHMTFHKKNELIETVRFGFGLRLLISVNDNTLLYRSNGHLWQWGKLRLTFPDWLLLGTATIIERPISEQQFELDFMIKHPLWGKTYWYRGVFQYCEQKIKSK